MSAWTRTATSSPTRGSRRCNGSSAAIRSVLAGTGDRRAFAGDDVVDAQGLDVVRTPAQVGPLVQPFISNNIAFRNVPA